MEIVEVNKRASARALQFWILILGSTLVSILMIKQTFVSRALNQEQRTLVDSEETASTASGYENAWKQLALHIFQASHQDPALANLLKNDNVEVHAKPTADTGTVPTTTASAPASSKAPVAPVRPAAP